MFALLSLLFFKLRSSSAMGPMAFSPGGMAARRGKERLEGAQRWVGVRVCMHGVGHLHVCVRVHSHVMCALFWFKLCSTHACSVCTMLDQAMGLGNGNAIAAFFRTMPMLRSHFKCEELVA